METTNNQLRLLMKLLTENKTLAVASAKSDLNEKTAIKYRNLGKFPEE